MRIFFPPHNFVLGPKNLIAGLEILEGILTEPPLKRFDIPKPEAKVVRDALSSFLNNVYGTLLKKKLMQ